MTKTKGVLKQKEADKKKSIVNNIHKASMKTAIKNVEKLTVKISEEERKNTLNVAIKRIDKALANGLVHRNFASRQKSRLTKFVNEIK